MSIKNSSSETVTQYEARAAWDSGILEDHFWTDITRAIVRNDTVSLEWPQSHGETAHTVLTKVDGSNKYIGKTVWASRTPKEEHAEVEAVLYSNEFGHVLVGHETWSSGEADWFVIQMSNGRNL